MVSGMWLLDLGSSGWLGAVGMLVLSVIVTVVMLGSVVLWSVLEERWRSWRGHAASFSETTQVDINARGLSIRGLGSVRWADVLSIEDIPDSESCLIVHTRPFGELLLEAPAQELGTLINHHMSTQTGPKPSEAPLAGSLRFRAVVFHWPRFRAWVMAGYLLAGAMGAALLFSDLPDRVFSSSSRAWACWCR